MSYMLAILSVRDKTKRIIESKPQINITEEEYIRIKENKDILSEASSIEEEYELLISSYLELENAFTEWLNKSMVRRFTLYEMHTLFRLKMDLRLMTVLNAAKIYHERLPSHVQNCTTSDFNGKQAVEELKNKEYDENFGYRFMEALRNHCQHYGYPIHSTSLNSKWTEKKLEFTGQFVSKIDWLQKDEDFKKFIMAELEEKEIQDIDLTKMVRCYIERLSYIHENAREIIAICVEDARKSIESAQEKYDKKANKKIASHAFACKLSSEGPVKEDVSLYLKRDDNRRKLLEKNIRLGKLQNKYVSTKV